MKRDPVHRPDGQPKLRIADLYCGGGGFTTAILNACEALRRDLELVTINHWDIAISTQVANHPGVRHLLTPIESVDPRKVIPGRHLDLLVAAPECIHHSNARGGQPMSDQSRASAWRVLEWCERIRVDRLIMENVEEFQSWGPLHPCRCGAEERAVAEGLEPAKVPHAKGGKCHRPIEREKGKYFRLFIRNLRALGYKTEWKVLNAANYGGATSRERFFLQARRDGKPILWPEPTHAPAARIAREAPQGTLWHRPLRPWRAAAEIIDWSVPGYSIYLDAETVRREKLPCKRPLVENTLRRIYHGLFKFSLVPFLVPNFGERDGQEPRCHSVRDPLPTITGHGAGGLVQPFLVIARGTSERALGDAGSQSVSEPLPTICADGNHFWLAQPYLVGAGGPEGQGRPKSAGDPLPTVLAESRLGVCQPFVIGQQSGAVARSTGEPLPTIAAKGAVSLVQPYLLPNEGYYRGNAPRSTDEPLPTATSRGAGALIQPYLVAMEHVGQAGRVHATDQPLPTVTAKGDFAIARPYLMSYHGGEGGERRTAGLEEPLRTVDASNRFGLCAPFLVPYYGTGVGSPVTEPLPTVTTRDRFALVHPCFREHVEDRVVGWLDILFRMLMPRELAAGMGFPKSYFFAGTQDDQVRQVGNAVEITKATALCLTMRGGQSYA